MLAALIGLLSGCAETSATAPAVAAAGFSLAGTAYTVSNGVRTSTVTVRPHRTLRGQAEFDAVARAVRFGVPAGHARLTIAIEDRVPVIGKDSRARRDRAGVQPASARACGR